jgi:uncharacterized protein YecE (DUF72 family)
MTTTNVADSVPRTLYDHAEDIRALYALLEELDDEDAEQETVLAQLAAWFSETEEAFERKVERVLAFARELEARASTCTEEAERLERIAKRDAEHVERLHRLVLDTLETLKRDRVRTARFGDVAVVSKGGQRSVVVLDEQLIPASFFGPPPSRGPLDKRNLASALEHAEKLGLRVPGATLAPRGKRLRVAR